MDIKLVHVKNKEGLIEGKDISRVLVKLKKTD